MTNLPELPEGAVQIGSIHILLGMGEKGQGIVYSFEGMSPEAVVGHLRSVVRRVEDQIDMNWAGDEAFEIGTFHFTCPECDEDVEVDADDVDATIVEDDDDDE